MARNRDNFPKKVAEMLGRRVSYICSNPSCRKRTLLPSKDPEKVLFTGVAAHISAAAPGGPRYDESLISDQRASAENGIFLCATCATMIDKNGGLDFPAELLRKWKAEHEKWIKDGSHEPVNRFENRMPLLGLCFDDGSTAIEIEKCRVTESERKKRIKGALSERLVRLDLKVANKGDAPASDVDVFMDFAGPFMLYDEKQLRRAWDVYPHRLFDNPEAFMNKAFGKRQGTEFQQIAGMLTDEMSFLRFKDLILPTSARTHNAPGAPAKESENRITVHLHKLKQNLVRPVQTIFIMFRSYEAVSSFKVPFILNTAETPVDVQGELEIIVKEKT